MKGKKDTGLRFRKLIYKNFFGDCKILITKSNDGTTPHRDTLIPSSEIYESTIWIHDNIVNKNHSKNNKTFPLNSKISYEELENLLKIK